MDRIKHLAAAGRLDGVEAGSGEIERQCLSGFAEGEFVRALRAKHFGGCGILDVAA